MALDKLVLVPIVASTACLAADAAPTAAPDAGFTLSEGDGVGLADATPSADATAGGCASPVVERWTGTAVRSSYPDHLEVQATWTRIGTVGCVDTYAPSGTATYRYAIPGALCAQWVTPETQAVAIDDGTLTIDRSTSPPTFSGVAATDWEIVFSMECDTGEVTEEHRAGGGPWLEISGVIADGGFAGSLHVQFESPDAARCHPGISPCEYEWSFTVLP